MKKGKESPKIILPIKILKIKGSGGSHLLLKIKINGKSARMLIDTGASKTVFDINRAANFLDESQLESTQQVSTGLGTRNMESRVAMLEKMKIGEYLIEFYFAVFIDLSHVNFAYNEIGQEPIDGVIGNDILVEYKAVIDYGKKELQLTRPKNSKFNVQ